MKSKNLLIISNDFPDKDNNYIRNIFVKEQVKSISSYFNRVYVISPLAYGIDKLRNTTYNNYEFNNVKVFFPKYFNFPLFYFYGRDFWIHLERNCVINLIRKENLNFDLIHAHFTWPSGAIAVELKNLFDVPVIITEHTHITLYKELDKKSRHYLRTWDLCDSIIRVNSKDIPLLISHGVPASKIIHIPNGFDPIKLSPISKDKSREQLGINNNMKLVLNIGRLYEEKGHKYLIDAFYHVVQKRKDVLCVIGGVGPLKGNLEKQIFDLHLQDHIFLIGFVQDHLLSSWMSACDVFVLPSLSESFGIVQIEAMACGKPVVATYNGGSEDIIVSKDYGYLVEPANSKDLAEGILLALEDKLDSIEIQNYAYTFKWSNISKKIEGVYRDVLERNSLQ